MVKRKIFLQLVIANVLIKSAYFLISQYSDKNISFLSLFYFNQIQHIKNKTEINRVNNLVFTNHLIRFEVQKTSSLIEKDIIRISSAFGKLNRTYKTELA